MKAREIKKAKRLFSSLLAMTVLLAGASVFAEAYNPDKVTVTSDNFETYDTILRAGGGDFPNPYQSTEQFTLHRSSNFQEIDSTNYPRLTSLFTEFMASDSYNNLTEVQKNNLNSNKWLIVDGEQSDTNGDFTGWGRPTVFNIVKTDDKNNNATLNNVENNSFLRVKTIAGMSNFAMYKKLNADADSDIQNKELTFKVSFKIPADGMKYAGDGFGIWLNNADMSEISTWSNFEYALDSGNQNNPANSYNKRELMAIKSVRETDGVKIKLYAFGNNVTTETPVVLDKDTEYTYTLTMTPDSSDGYKLSGKLSKGGEDTTIWFSPANWQGYASGIPKRADIASMTHMTVMAAHNDSVINGDIVANASAENEKYINGHSMIYVDDISLTADYTYPTREMIGSGLSATARKNGNKVYVNVKNIAADEKNVKLIAAVYDGDQLKGVKIDNTVSVIESNGTQKVEFNFGEGEIADGNKVKVFIWDSLSNVTPLTTAAGF